MTAVLIRKRRDQGQVDTEERRDQCEDRMTKWLSASQGERAQGKFKPASRTERE